MSIEQRCNNISIIDFKFRNKTALTLFTVQSSDHSIRAQAHTHQQKKKYRIS